MSNAVLSMHLRELAEDEAKCFDNVLVFTRFNREDRFVVASWDFDAEVWTDHVGNVLLEKIDRFLELPSKNNF